MHCACLIAMNRPSANNNVINYILQHENNSALFLPNQISTMALRIRQRLILLHPFLAAQKRTIDLAAMPSLFGKSFPVNHIRKTCKTFKWNAVLFITKMWSNSNVNVKSRTEEFILRFLKTFCSRSDMERVLEWSMSRVMFVALL